MVSKTLQSRRTDLRGEPRFAFTMAVNRRNATNLHALRNGPVLLQEQVEKRTELRITLAGDAVFAAEVDSQAAASTRVDWRRMAEPRLRWRTARLPDGVVESLSGLMRRMGLSFGAVDMILTPDGRTVFLEVNALGDWLFIEEQLDLPITAAVADLLMTRTVEAVA
jgi:glutathione synthase/RimK-type ligase-like ATP-grasp enzyme